MLRLPSEVDANVKVEFDSDATSSSHWPSDAAITWFVLTRMTSEPGTYTELWLKSRILKGRASDE